MVHGSPRRGRVLAAMLSLACLGSQADAADPLLPAGKCPFALEVTAAMRAQPVPFGSLAETAIRYRAVEEADAIRVSFSQKTGTGRIAYAIRCSAADPAKWLARFDGDEAAVCRMVDRARKPEAQGNGYCALSERDGARVLLTGTWAKDAKSADLVQSRARLTAALPGAGMLSARVTATSRDSGEARALAEQLLATLAVGRGQ